MTSSIRAEAPRIVASLVAVGLFVAGCGAARGDRPPPGDALDQVEASQLFHLGNELAERGDSIRAEQYLSAAMSRGYPEVEVMPRLMEVCIGASRLSAALGYAEPYLRRHEDDWSLRLLVATIQMTLNQVEPARTNLERVVMEQPDEAAAHYLLGVLLRDRLVENDEANVHFARYLELDPRGAHAREAQLSIAGEYRRERSHEEVEDEPATAPVRLPSHDTDAPDEDTSGGEVP